MFDYAVRLKNYDEPEPPLFVKIQNIVLVKIHRDLTNLTAQPNMLSMPVCFCGT